MATRHRGWPWDEAHDNLEKMEHAELRMLRWLIDMQVAQGHLLVHLSREQEKQMATLDNLTAAIADIATDIDKVAADVLAALADLRAQIEALVVGQVTQEQIDSLTASVTAADAAVEALDAAVPEQPVVEPPPA